MTKPRYITTVMCLLALATCAVADGVTESETTVVSGDFRLPATLTMPDGARAGVVLVHGSGPNDRDETAMACHPFKDIAEGLSARGIAVLRYDKRTKVYGNQSVPEGKEMDIDDEVTDDAIAAVVMLKDLLGGGNVIVVSHSLGAMLAPRIAERCADVSGIVMLGAPARDIISLTKDQIKYLVPGTDDETARAQAEKLKAAAPESYWKSLDSYDQIKTARQLEIPMLIVQGGRDYQVPVGEYYMWARGMMGKKNCKLLLCPTLNHLMVSGEGKSTPQEYAIAGTVAQEVIDAISDFVKLIQK